VPAVRHAVRLRSQVLIKCRDALAELKLDPKALELSMGMSADYELAVSFASTSPLFLMVAR
jgi:uncharacterized pyridoxal phosphate-containing UPF0001 family protein